MIPLVGYNSTSPKVKSMKILVIGSRGGMGLRYSAIIRYLGHDLLEYDPAVLKQSMPEPNEYDAAIIATPISEHTIYLKMIMNSKPVLCEKPISCDIQHVKDIARYSGHRGCAAFMVNNWAFVGEHREPMGEDGIVVNCYNTGKDGIWDLIQPLYLVEDIHNFECVHSYPWLSVMISGKGYGRDDFDRSYVDMVQSFIDGDYDKLWPLERMVEAHKRVEDYGMLLYGTMGV